MLLRLTLVSTFLFVACGGPAKVSGSVSCSAANCSGCCDAHDTCQQTSLSTCGINGNACLACGTGLTCSQAGVCALSNGVGGGGGSGTGGGAGTDGCTDAAKLIYTVDTNETLSSFNPANVGTSLAPFTTLGRLNCNASFGASPFSMAVDRNAIAWVIYDSGELFSVNVADPNLPCTATTFVPQGNVARFGMGFVSNTSGSTDETLYISGSSLTSSLTTTTFGTLSTTPPYAVTTLGTLSGAPELTGTGDAKLWAFFPNLTPPKVSQLDKTTGAQTTTFPATALQGLPMAWAFGFWGGDFWIFLRRDTDASTHVWRMNAQTGAVTDAVPDTGKTIVGAGVSTCAPVTIN